MTFLLIALVVLGLAATVVSDVRSARRHASLHKPLVEVRAALTVTTAQQQDLGHRLATITASLDNMRGDLTRVGAFTSTNAGELAETRAAIVLLPDALASIRGAVEKAIERFEEHEVPLELSKQHQGVLARVQRAREQMAANEEASWNSWLHTVSKREP